jgi:hypothetical protein
VATAWLALLFGELVQIDGCVRVKDRDSDTSYLLVWPPDTAMTIEQDMVRIETGIVTGDHKEFVAHFGDQVRLGGGEETNINQELKSTVPAHCTGPYWVMGDEVVVTK